MGQSRPIRVGVIFGGRSGEHEVSLRSARAVMAALDPARYEVVPIGITREGRWLMGGDPLARLEAGSRLARLEGQVREPAVVAPEGEQASGGDADAVEILPTRADRRSPGPLDAEHLAAFQRAIVPPATGSGSRPAAVPAVLGTGDDRPLDVIFPVLHGPYGEDGTVQGMLELAGLPYVGAGVLASAVAMDKAMAKTVLAQHGIPQAPWLELKRREWERDSRGITARIGSELDFPCFVKPANLGSSVGISKVHHEGELAAALDLAARFDRKLVVERGIDGRELEVSVLGNDDPIASVVSEIHPAHEFYDYEAKYIDEGTVFTLPADIPAAKADELRDLALRAFRALDCAGMARVDFFLERGSDRLLLNELNTIPGFTPISQYPKMWEASGLSFSELVNRLIELAIERHAERRESL